MALRLQSESDINFAPRKPKLNEKKKQRKKKEKEKEKEKEKKKKKKKKKKRIINVGLHFWSKSCLFLRIDPPTT